MKRAAIVVFVLAIAASAVSAQTWGPGSRVQAPAQQAEIVKIEGKLALVNTHPAVVVNNKTYYVGIPAHLYGFVDGLKEGATVKLEGYAYPLPYATDTFMFQVTKLTLGGREIDLSQVRAFGPGARGMMGGQGRGQGRGQGQGQGRW